MTSQKNIPEILNGLFSPRKENITPLSQGSYDLEIPVSGRANLLGCRLHAADKSNPLILYFHGNGETVADHDEIAQEYLEAGLNIFIATYRGYGWSTGEPSVSVLFDDAEAILDYLLDHIKENEMNGPLFVMGRSLGSVSAVNLVVKHPDLFKGLILDSAIVKTIPLAEKLGIVVSDNNIREEDCFNNLGKIKDITLPTMILHGARDQFISVSEAEILQSESGARTKQFHVIPGADHNSLISNGGKLYFSTIKKFTDTVTGKNTWRKRRKRYSKNKG